MSIRFTADDSVERNSNLPGLASSTALWFSRRQSDTNNYSTQLGWEDGGNFAICETDNDGDTLTFWSDTITALAFTPSVTLVNGVWRVTAITFDASKNYAGRSRLLTATTWSTNTGGSGSGMTTPATLRIGDFFGGEDFDGDIASVKIWSAQLTAAELEAEAQQITPVRINDLWGFYPMLPNATDRIKDYGPNGYDFDTTNGTLANSDMPPVPWGGRIIVVGRAAGGVARDMDGTAAAVSGSSADLAVSRPLGATAVAVSGVDGSFVADVELDSTAASVSGHQADLDAGRNFDAIPAAISGQQSDLARVRDLQATATAVSGIPAADAVVARDMVSTAAAVSGQQSDASTTREITSTAAAVSGHDAELTIAGQANMDGTSAAVSSHQADLAATREITSTAAVVSGDQADLARAVDHDSTAAAITSHQADLDGGRGLDSDSAVVSGHQADAEIARDLTSTAAAVSDQTSNLDILGEATFNGTCAAVSGDQADAAVSRPITSTSSAVSSHAATLARLRELISTAPVLTGHQALLDGGRDFDSTSAVISGHQADLDVVVGLTLLDGTATAVSSDQADLAILRPLLATLAAVSAIDGTINRQTGLLATCSVLAINSGDLATVITPPTFIELQGTLVEQHDLLGDVTDQIDLDGTV